MISNPEKYVIGFFTNFPHSKSSSSFHTSLRHRTPPTQEPHHTAVTPQQLHPASTSPYCPHPQQAVVAATVDFPYLFLPHRHFHITILTPTTISFTSHPEVGATPTPITLIMLLIPFQATAVDEPLAPLLVLLLRSHQARLLLEDHPPAQFHPLEEEQHLLLIELEQPPEVPYTSSSTISIFLTSTTNINGPHQVPQPHRHYHHLLLLLHLRLLQHQLVIIIFICSTLLLPRVLRILTDNSNILIMIHSNSSRVVAVIGTVKSPLDHRQLLQEDKHKAEVMLLGHSISLPIVLSMRTTMGIHPEWLMNISAEPSAQLMLHRRNQQKAVSHDR
jgi:hypothetical protein